MAADRPYGEFYGFHSVSPEYFGFIFVQRPGSEADHLPPSSAVKNAYSPIFTPHTSLWCGALTWTEATLPNLAALRRPVHVRKLPSLNQTFHYSDDCYINLTTPLATAQQFRTLWRPRRIIHHLLTGRGRSKLFVLFNGELFLFNVTWQ
jgi:hypothetical protein